MWQDLRYAIRLLAKSPAFTAVAVITIALGVGPNTAIFSMINAVLLRPLPYRDSQRIVMLWETWKARGFDQLPVSGPTFLDWKSQNRSFEDMAPAFTIPEYGFNVTSGGEPERAQAAQAGANFFSVLGVQPVLGRAFLPEEDKPGGRAVALLGHRFWQRRFGGDRGILGGTIGLDGTSCTVVGVLPPEIDAIAKVDVWIPIGKNLAAENRGNHNFGIMARLRPGVSAEQAQREMDAIEKQIEMQYPGTNAGIGVTVMPINQLVAGPIRPALLVLFAAVAFLLLIACANVASLLLARAAARQKEIALRASLGASPFRVVRQVLTESLLLSGLGGLLGTLLAFLCLQSLRSVPPELLPRLGETNIDFRVLLFTLGISALTGVLFGLAPALRASKADLNSALKEGGGRGAIGGSSHRLRSVLLTAEVALSLILLAGAGLMARSFLRVTGLDPGFRADQTLTMHLTLTPSKYGDPRSRTMLTKSVIEKIATLPGVRSAAAISYLPMRGRILDLRISIASFQVEGQPAAQPGLEPTADYRVITPGFLKTMGIPLRRGRDFTEHDQADSKRVVLINDTMARLYFAKQDPAGRRIRVGREMREVVGVVADVRMNGLEKSVDPAIYAPFEQDPPPQFSLVVRSASDPLALTAAVRRKILEVDSEQPVADVRTMQQVVDDSLIVRRLATWLLGIFAGLALALAGVGVYGLVSYSVTQRTNEIGLRVALGAQPADVLRMVVQRGLVVSLIGVALGLPAAFALAQLIRGLLFGVTAADPMVFVGVPVLLVAVAAMASYLPARRAMRIDPTAALRSE